MPQIRIVTAAFHAETYAQGPTRRSNFPPETWLVMLRHEPENASTFFALVSDIPSVQPCPPQHLPEYMADTETFENSTRTPG